MLIRYLTFSNLIDILYMKNVYDRCIIIIVELILFRIHCQVNYGKHVFYSVINVLQF